MSYSFSLEIDKIITKKNRNTVPNVSKVILGKILK